MGRWVCLRCFESNDAALMACAKCGLARGAPPQPASAGYAPRTDPGAAAAMPQPTQPTEPGNALLGLLRRFGWIAVVALFAIIGWWFSAGRGESGELTRSGNLSVTDLRVGDCFSLKDPGAETIGEVDAKVCSEPHEFEMMFVGNLPHAELPGEGAMRDWVGANCLPAFDAYVGLAFEDSALDIFQFVPTEDSWDQGDHSIQCAIYDPQESQLTGSLRNAAR
jgi:hypothetical protein